MDQGYWAYVKTSRRYTNIGPFASREQAIAEGWKNAPAKIKSISTGYGSRGADFDIRPHSRYDYEASIAQNV